MSVEAIIDGPQGRAARLNDTLGECEGLVVGYEDYAVDVQVTPDPQVCDRCPISEFCTASKAD